MSLDLDRRALLIGGAGSLVAGLAVADQPARVTIEPGEVLNELPADYLGLSIEKMALGDPRLYDAGNASLVAFFHRLTPKGVLRVGGNTSDYCWWKASPDAQPPATPSGLTLREDWHAITPAAIDTLAAFLEATGWRAIWGLNFGLGDAEMAAREARAVAAKLGARLLYFQIGNEPDFYDHKGNELRGAGWSFDTFFREWTAVADAVAAAVPGARFGAPDSGASPDWVVAMANRAKDLGGKTLVELTGHYYIGGPNMSDPVGRLLSRDPRIAREMETIMPAARRAGLPYRMAEGNSIFRGGKAGVSNAFVSALWGLDYLLTMASLGCQGVDLHAGSGQEIAVAVGGRLDGARDIVDLLNARLGTFYSPIAGDRASGFAARPLFYGMMAAQPFAGTRLVRTGIDAGGANVTAYASRGPQGWRIAVINKERDRDIMVSVPAKPLGIAAADLWRLSAMSLDAESGVTLANGEVAPADAAWTRRPEKLDVGDETRLLVPRASAAVVLAR